MSKPYYTLCILEDDRWSPQFGDRDLAVVTQEREDSYSDVPRKRTRIITTSLHQRDVDDAVTRLNREHTARQAARGA